MPSSRYRNNQADRLRQLAEDEGSAEALADFGAARIFAKRDQLGRAPWVAIRHQQTEAGLVQEFLSEPALNGARSWVPAEGRDVFCGAATAQAVTGFIGEGVAVRAEAVLRG